MGRYLSVLSNTNVTSANPKGFLELEPEKITSSILEPRRVLALCSPKAHLIASAMLLFPDPLGPTIAVIPGEKVSSVLSAKDLNP